MEKIKISLCQMMISKDKNINLNKAKTMIDKSVEKGAEIVVLPEMFNCPYNNKFFPKYAESFPKGETLQMLSSISKKNNIYLVGGSIPEKDDSGNIYNTSFVFDNLGNLIGKHKKIHLFDINIKDKIKFKESDILTRGNKITLVDTKWGKIGIAICYDIRFPELMRIMALEGAKIVFIPAAFNMTTGPAHWETLFKSRALDNQIFMVGASPARDINSPYIAYGNSLIVGPFGNIIKKLDEKEDILICDINLDEINKIREELPLLKHRREDIYTIKKNNII